MAPRTKKPPVSEVINGIRFNNELPSQKDARVERELLSISVSKLARDLVEELGTSCGLGQYNSDTVILGGEDPHESIDSVRETLEIGTGLGRVGWGSNAITNRASYLVGTGHGPVTIKPKLENDPAGVAAAARVQAYLDVWVRDSEWYARQAEVSHRLDTDGEVFDILSYAEDGVLQLQYAEPADLDDDPKSDFAFTEDSELEFTDWLGVRRTNDLMYKPVAYFIDGIWYADLQANTTATQLATLPDENVLIQHRKRNVLSRDNRGLTLFWPVRDELNWSKKLLSNMTRVSTFQASVGALRSISDAHSVDSVRDHLQSMQSGKAGSPAEVFDSPAPSIVTVPDAIKWTFPDASKSATNQVEVLNALLQACSSGLHMPEFMLSSNVSDAAFASTLVSEAPFVKLIENEQQKMINEDLRILYQVLRWAAEKTIEGLSHTDIDNIVIEITPPAVSTRKWAEDFAITNALHDKKIISSQTLAQSEGYEYESEQAQIAAETPTPPATGLPLQGAPPAQTPPVSSADRNPLSDNNPSADAVQPPTIS